ncbi:MAG: hypothetical protein OEN49_07000 [Gammaproteobacteria bacterium]|nr:hypothetical protein [Gammaproteobacteria bacterium]
MKKMALNKAFFKDDCETWKKDGAWQAFVFQLPFSGADIGQNQASRPRAMDLHYRSGSGGKVKNGHNLEKHRESHI